MLMIIKMLYGLYPANSLFGVFVVNKDICRLLHVVRSLLYFYLAR